MSDHDNNGDRADKQYVIVDHSGMSASISDHYRSDLDVAIFNALRPLPVGGRFTVTRVA